MVKRKAEISIEEWLGERGIQLDSQPGVTPAADEGPVSAEIPAAPVLPEPATAEPVDPAQADVAAPGSREAEWFWEMLEAAGYKTW